jgi:hypothetical protein
VSGLKSGATGCRQHNASEISGWEGRERNAINMSDPLLLPHYFKKKSEGQPFKKAVFATAHKLMRVIFAMLSHKTYFQEECI